MGNILSFVVRVMRVVVLKALVGLVVEVVDVIKSEVEKEIVAVFVDVDVLKAVAEISDKIVDV